MGRHLHFPVPLHQHLGTLEGVDVLLALAKVDGLVGALGSVAPLPVPLSFEVSGKDLATASPRTIALSDTDTREAFQPITEKLVSAVMGILEVTPPELGADIMRQGMLLTGGGALLRGFADRITRATRIPVYVDSDPLTTVLRGAGITLDDPEKYRDEICWSTDDIIAGYGEEFFNEHTLLVVFSSHGAFEGYERLNRIYCKDG